MLKISFKKIKKKESAKQKQKNKKTKQKKKTFIFKVSVMNQITIHKLKSVVHIWYGCDYDVVCTCLQLCKITHKGPTKRR